MSGTDAASAKPPEGELFSQRDINFPFMVEDAAIELSVLQIWDQERKQGLNDERKAQLRGARALMIASGGETAFALAAASPKLFDSGIAVDMNVGQYHMCLLKQALFESVTSGEDALAFLQNSSAVPDSDADTQAWRRDILASKLVSKLPATTQGYWMGSLTDAEAAQLDADVLAARRKQAAGFYANVIRSGPFSLGFRQQGAIALSSRLHADHIHPDLVEAYYEALQNDTAEEKKNDESNISSVASSTPSSQDKVAAFYERFFTRIAPLSSLVLAHSSRQASQAIASARETGDSTPTEEIMKAIRAAYDASLKTLAPHKSQPSDDSSPLLVGTASQWSPAELATLWVSAVTACIMPSKPWASTRISYIIARALAAGDIYNWFTRSFYASFKKPLITPSSDDDTKEEATNDGIKFESSPEALSDTAKWVSHHLSKVTSEQVSSGFFLPERVEIALANGQMTPETDTSFSDDLNKLAYSYPPYQKENSYPVCYRPGVFEHIRPRAITFEHKSFLDALRDAEPGSLDFVHVSNIMDWLPESLNRQLLTSLDRALADGGVCTFRTGPFDTPLRFGLRELVATTFDVDSNLSDFFRDTERCYIYYDTIFARKRKTQ